MIERTQERAEELAKLYLELTMKAVSEKSEMGNLMKEVATKAFIDGYLVVEEGD